MIICRDVSISIGGHLVLTDLSVQLETNRNYLITGANGSGKTTLLKLLAGKAHPQSGTVSYDFIPDNIDWEEKFDLRRSLVHLVPAQALHDLLRTPDLFYQQRYYSMESSPLPTVRDYLGHRIERLDSIQLSDSFRLNKLLDQKLTEMSNGQLKKVIIVKQLLDSIPKVLLLDYPFEGLDAVSRKELASFLDSLVATHGIQLIIADKEHAHLPQSLTQKLTLINRTVAVTERKAEAITREEPASRPSHPERSNARPPVVEMQGLRIQYGDRVVIDHLDWKIYRGDRWALTGPNGSGKTTLFSLIFADHPKAYSERVFVFGQRRGTGESIWDIKKRISYLGPEQIHYADPATERLTVRAFLSGGDPSTFDNLIRQFEVNHLLERPLHALSHGEWQLVFLLSMFLSQKELLLLDEPFQFLDELQHGRVNEYLHSHLDELSTLILVTHYEEDVARWTHQRLALG
jgi:molybdate transport system ATP-binding protein